MSDTGKSFVRQGKKPREELRLPQLHFIVADDWIEKLGEKTFCYWLKLLSFADRTDEGESKYGNKSTVPRSLENLYKVFGISKASFYKNVIHPLWDYGLIDIVDWSDSKKIGTKPKNIIVYEYPQNKYELAVKSLEKCRDYKKDYNSQSAIFGRIGGQRKKEEKQLRQQKTVINYRLNFKTLDRIKVSGTKPIISNRLNSKTLTVLKTKPLTVQLLKPINETNTTLNESNTMSNEPKGSLLDFKEEEEKKNIILATKLCSENVSYSHLAKLLHNKGLEQGDISKTIIECHSRNLDFFMKKDVIAQYNYMMEILEDGKTHTNFAFYFAEGLKRRTDQSKLGNLYREEKEKATKEKKNRDTSFYYNWLE